MADHYFTKSEKGGGLQVRQRGTKMGVQLEKSSHEGAGYKAKPLGIKGGSHGVGLNASKFRMRRMKA